MAHEEFVPSLHGAVESYLSQRDKHTEHSLTKHSPRQFWRDFPLMRALSCWPVRPPYGRQCS